MEAAGTKVLDTVGCHEIHSILVCKNNALVFEEYFYGNNDTINFENNVARVPNGHIQWSRNLKHYIASATKAITSTIVGIALDQKGLTPDVKISAYLPTYASMFTGQKANLTLKHCLNMESGFDWNEWGGPDLNNMWNVADTDFTFFVLNHNIRSTPGTEWVYCSGLPNVEHHVIQNMVQDSEARFIRLNLLAPLGITDIKWETQHGHSMLPEGAAKLFIRPRDMLKWGITCINNGQWQGKQVIPAAWIAACKQVQYNGNYSNHFWITNYTYGGKTVTAFSAEGDGGNYICMFPTLNLVVVFTGGLYLESPTYDNQITNILTTYILPAVG
jgi:CubicO group peptidase (beta-lactamase class C family)